MHVLNRKNANRVAVVVAAIAAIVLVPSPAGADPGPEQHCVVVVDGGGGKGPELEVIDQRCFDQFSEVLDAVGAPADIRENVTSPDELSSSDMRRLAPTPGSERPPTYSASAIIGIHYDGFSASGSSFSVSGSNCAGGYLNVSTAWNNRISSTVNGCPTIRHVDGFNLVGTSESTTGGGGNLSYMNNRTSSIQYL